MLVLKGGSRCVGVWGVSGQVCVGMSHGLWQGVKRGGGKSGGQGSGFGAHEWGEGLGHQSRG